MFGLFGLLIALSFSFVIVRSDARRAMLVEETSAWP